MLGLWGVASAFFAIVGWRTLGRIVAVGADRPASLAGARAFGVTAAYSLGAAALLLGAAWVVLPRAHRRGLPWSAILWLCVTAALLAGRQVAGWPLVLAAAAALAIGLDVLRRLLVAFVGRRPDPQPVKTGV